MWGTADLPQFTSVEKLQRKRQSAVLMHAPVWAEPQAAIQSEMASHAVSRASLQTANSTTNAASSYEVGRWRVLVNLAGV